MSPLSRPRRRRLLLMNEPDAATAAVVPDDGMELISPVPPTTAGMMRNRFLEDCGVPEGFSVQVSVQGRVETETVSVEDAFTFIGRDEECGILLTGPDIARHHAYLQAVAGQFVIVDLGSRTGMKQNGRIVRTALLHSGDTIEIGPYVLKVVREAGADFHRFPSEAQLQRQNPPIALAFVNQAKPVDPWTVDTPLTLIGSAKPSRIRLEHSSVSPQHCAIIRGFTSWWLVDLSSQAGTLLDDATITFAPLAVGAELQVGRYRIAIRKPMPAESIVAPPVIEDRPAADAPARVASVTATSLVDVLPTAPLATAPAAPQGPVVNEHLVIELFREFAALHERTVRSCSSHSGRCSKSRQPIVPHSRRLRPNPSQWSQTRRNWSPLRRQRLSPSRKRRSQT